jgi:hypothetical protein
MQSLDPSERQHMMTGLSALMDKYRIVIIAAFNVGFVATSYLLAFAL